MYRTAPSAKHSYLLTIPIDGVQEQYSMSKIGVLLTTKIVFLRRILHRILVGLSEVS